MANLPTEIKIKINLDDVKPLIADCLDPGAVLLPAKAVQALLNYMSEGSTMDDVYNTLAECGGIRSSGVAE